VLPASKQIPALQQHCCCVWPALHENYTCTCYVWQGKRGSYIADVASWAHKWVCVCDSVWYLKS
jgi:hypothetical protein